MRISLRLRVLLLVAAVNVGVFGAGLAFLTPRIAEVERRHQLDLAEQLFTLIRPTPPPSEDIWVEQLLRWPYWRLFADAIVVYRRWEEGPQGEIRPRGVFLNPLGSLQRSPSFQMSVALRDARRSMESRGSVVGDRGTSVPIYDQQGDVWGACWYRAKTSVSSGEVLLSLLPWFLLSTVLLTLGTFGLLRRFVLDPVEQLAAGSQRVRSGDFAVRVPEPRHGDELSDLVRAFNEMTRDVQAFHEHLEEEADAARAQARKAEAAAIRQKQLAAMGELAAGIAHEINNPLGGLLNAVETLHRDDLVPERRVRYLGLLQDGLERIQGTVRKLLRFTPRDAERRPFALDEAVRDAVSLAQHRAEALGVEVELRATEQVLVMGLRSELGQAVLNLLFNSLDAIEEGGAGRGRIEIDVERRGAEVLLLLADDGPGVPPEVLERVADHFYTTKEVGKGTGLGLALVVDVVERHDGRVSFSSEPGAGFAVEVALPAWSGGRA